MPYIHLYKDNRSMGTFDVPEHITSKARHIYKLKNVALGGGNGIVFNALRIEKNKTGSPCAIKMLRQQSAARIDRFNNEVRIIKELSSPYIATYHDDGEVSVTCQENTNETQKVRWLAMELGGVNMRQHIETKGPLQIKNLKTVVHDICESVKHLHDRDFIHRDIKPDNFVWKDRSEKSIMMIDFGIAKKIGEDVSARPLDTFTQITEFVGPVFFSSPELIEYAANKSHPVDQRSDIFQVGKVIWFLATGKISAGVPSKRDCPANGRIRDLVVEMIDDDPDSRIQTLQEVQRRLTEI